MLGKLASFFAPIGSVWLLFGGAVIGTLYLVEEISLRTAQILLIWYAQSWAVGIVYFIQLRQKASKVIRQIKVE